MSMMSLSPTTSTSNYDETPSTKRRRTTSFTAAANGGPRSEMASPQDSPSGHGASSSVAAAHIPKRGARACTNCRKGKNRCEGEVRILHLSRLAAGCLPVPRPSPSRLPAHPPGPANCSPCIHPLCRLPVVDASLAAHNASSRNQRRRMCRPCPPPASSKSPHNLFPPHIAPHPHPMPDLTLMPPSTTPRRRLSRLEGQYLVRPPSICFRPSCV